MSRLVFLCVFMNTLFSMEAKLGMTVDGCFLITFFIFIKGLSDLMLEKPLSTIFCTYEYNKYSIAISKCRVSACLFCFRFHWVAVHQSHQFCTLLLSMWHFRSAWLKDTSLKLSSLVLLTVSWVFCLHNEIYLETWSMLAYLYYL